MLLCSSFNLFTLPNISSSYKGYTKKHLTRYCKLQRFMSCSPFSFPVLPLQLSRNH